MTNTDKNRKSKNDKKSSPIRKGISYFITVVSLLVVGFTVVNELGLLDDGTPIASDTNSTVNEPISLPSTAPNTAQSGQIAQQEIDVPLLSVQSHDELSNLHLLAKRVRAEDEDAATLFGLQRISIHAKRQQAKEVSLLMKINSDMYVAEKARIDTNNYVNNGGIEKTSQPSQSENKSATESEYFEDSLMRDGNKDAFGMETTPVKEVVGFTDLRLKGLSNHRAYITVKNEPFKNVKTGQTFAGRFSLKEVNHQSECVRVRDSRFEELDTNEYAVICLN
ncbi:hypothetical protein AB4455_07935 [Vibrio sp. 10N.261.46.E12]|nr:MULTISPECIES: hypothetical protein [unclassified Vibrio]OMO34471.1 hypothetical protein BH584_12650 [Vibrio sp. 10N.261.45.E1]PMJ26206.1 hypothetical protein BCU27_09635 [Vibrio sp. 10N.286.45.B6]PML82800.1 hypothetical protein BCT66_20130 [Vibrio sp. 10N.261.49.E11]PMM90324.1 hypothetical protein BCT46_23555 [Vibrio sp. 10N.261.46.E8]PMN43944.1 hypothetical protein BCT32_00835 [Vibrio sp. 10N.261.45.E11]